MSTLTNPKWWAAATVRAIKTAAQAAIAFIRILWPWVKKQAETAEARLK